MQNSGGSQPNNSCDIGVIGLGVMGKNLALNLADHGYQVACFDLDAKRIDAIVAQDRNENGADSSRIVPVHTLEALRSSLVSPAVILLSIPAGKPVDMVCEQLIAAGIDSEDVIIDTGNSLWSDSVAREQRFADKFLFFTTAVSGGEVGARFGPSLMPSGSEKAWQRVGPMLRAIAAKVDPETGKPIETATPGEPVKHGEPCAAYIGPNGAGHYVKMVHNGIEYADMQLICEAYQIMRVALGMSPGEIAAVFRRWNQGPLDSYLIEISAEVLDQQDPETQQPLVDVILDKAGMKGTGLWTAVSALQTGSPAQTIAQAVFARSLSALKSERVEAAKVLAGPEAAEVNEAQREAVINQLEHALYCSKICAYAQGFQLMNAAAQEQGWTLHFTEIAKIWRAGCIIRAVFLQSISNAFERDINLPNLLVDPFFAEQIATYQADWRATVALSAVQGVACPAMMSALSYYDSYRTAVLPANLLQGQRDFFGAHTFSRTDKPAAEKYHVEWSDPSRPLQLIQQQVCKYEETIMADNDQWRDKLTEEEYRVTRLAGTERPFSGTLLYESGSGSYVCKCCGVKLFDHTTKFESGCGWPSFFSQSEDDNVGYRFDESHGMRRTEIFCKNCDAHLGHVFSDGPAPTGQRYCVNSVSLDFNPEQSGLFFQEAVVC